ncbi:MAG: hypothetical protein A2X49_16470 [Lentisphaerae bacterium GWF2_52_8]|nr:MAG: hypothetical protein A2X49_16470 [Lentisphaerae bacterium GWF2_52_8]
MKLFLNGMGAVIDDRPAEGLLARSASNKEDICAGSSERNSSLRRELRRSGSFVAAAVTALAEAVDDSKIPERRRSSSALILTQSYGDPDSTAGFIDEILDYGVEQGSPIKFAHSSLNMALAYAAKLLKITGPTLSLVNFQDTILNGLTAARTYLEAGLCRDAFLIHCESNSRLTQLIAAAACGRELESYLSATDENYFRAAFSSSAVCLSLGDAKGISTAGSLDWTPDMNEGECLPLSGIDSRLSVAAALASAVSLGRALPSDGFLKLLAEDEAGRRIGFLLSKQ